MARTLIKRLVIDPLKPFGEEEWKMAGRPRAIATSSTGTDHVDLEYFIHAGVKVFSLLDDREALAEIRASSEYTFMAILMGLRRIDRVMGSTDRREAGHELYGKTVGVVGAGRIGQNVMRWCVAFGATVVWHDPYRAGYSLPLNEIFAMSDIVCITCSLTEETAHMIDFRLLDSMKENAVLVNTSRGAVINEAALIDVFRKRPDLTAVLDVMEGELDNGHLKSPLWSLKNVIVTPHIAGHTVESEAKAREIAEGLLAAHETVVE